MNARLSRAWLVAILLAAFMVVAGKAYAKTNVRYDFEKDLAPWVGASDRGLSGASFARVTGDNGCLDVNGDGFASLKINPSSGATTAWMSLAHEVGAPGIEQVRISVSGRDVENCATCEPLVYAGSAKPSAGVGFKKLLAAQDERPMPIGWTRYTYETNTKVNDLVYVALGWRYGTLPPPPSPGLSSALRNEYLYDKLPVSRPVDSSAFGFDCVSIDIFPAP